MRRKGKKKKKKKKKKSSPHFVTFPPSILIFNLPFFDFPSFLLHPFFLTSLFPVGQQKFPDQTSLGHSTPPPPPPPACYATAAATFESSPSRRRWALGHPSELWLTFMTSGCLVDTVTSIRVCHWKAPYSFVWRMLFWDFGLDLWTRTSCSWTIL